MDVGAGTVVFIRYGYILIIRRIVGKDVYGVRCQRGNDLVTQNAPNGRQVEGAGDLVRKILDALRIGALPAEK